MRFRIALRNVLRNRLRTFLNVLMIAAGMTAIVVFKGFTHNLIRKLEWVAVNNQYGHIQVANPKLWNLSAKDSPKDRLMRADSALIKQIEAVDGVKYATGRLTFFGLINNGEQTLSARGLGIDPARETRLLSSFLINDGRNLNSDSRFEILMGKGLREQIGVEVGARITVLGYTFDGSVNALDCELVGVFQSGLADVDNSTFLIPLATAQRLLDTDDYERLIIQLHETDDTPRVFASVSALNLSGLVPRVWTDLALYYRQVVEFFGVQNAIIQWILMLLALLAIGNIVGMSISERTGEIGTVRAMGDSRGDVLGLFLVEGFILGVIGGSLGCVMGYLSCLLVGALQIPIVTPGASGALTIEVDIVPQAFVQAFLSMCVMAIVATLIPAWRASRFEIVEALKRNI